MFYVECEDKSTFTLLSSPPLLSSKQNKEDRVIKNKTQQDRTQLQLQQKPTPFPRSRMCGQPCVIFAQNFVSVHDILSTHMYTRNGIVINTDRNQSSSWKDKTRQTKQGKTRQDKTRENKIKPDKTTPDKTTLDKNNTGKAQHQQRYPQTKHATWPD
jgi:hypothetical protein